MTPKIATNVVISTFMAIFSIVITAHYFTFFVCFYSSERLPTSLIPLITSSIVDSNFVHTV
jgi:hypothetical protein